jgi:hypothetical protein
MRHFPFQSQGQPRPDLCPGELGYSKITNILTALGLELKLQEASAGRPTLEELMEEARDDQSLDRRR